MIMNVQNPQMFIAIGIVLHWNVKFAKKSITNAFKMLKFLSKNTGLSI